MCVGYQASAFIIGDVLYAVSCYYMSYGRKAQSDVQMLHGFFI